MKNKGRFGQNHLLNKLMNLGPKKKTCICRSKHNSLWTYLSCQRFLYRPSRFTLLCFMCSQQRRRFLCGTSWMSLAPRCSTLSSPAVAWLPSSTYRASLPTLYSGLCRTCRKEVTAHPHTNETESDQEVRILKDKSRDLCLFFTLSTQPYMLYLNPLCHRDPWFSRN